MASRYVSSWALSCTFLVGILASTAARADYFSSWIATTCDPGSGMAAVRFGYADADDAPLFMHADPSIDHGLTAMPTPNASQQEASCSLPSGREVRVRLVIGNENEVDEYSVWVDKIKVIHAAIDTNGRPIPFAVIIYPNGFRACHFGSLRDVYDVTTAGQNTPVGTHSPPPSINCDTALSPVKGFRDLVEFPASGKKRPSTGTVLVTQSTNEKLCHDIIYPPVNGEDGDEVQDDDGAPAAAPAPSSIPTAMPRKPNPTEKTEWNHVRAGVFDFWLPNGGAANLHNASLISADDTDASYHLKDGVLASLVELSLSRRPQKVDLDNSGTDQWVLQEHEESHAMEADVYYLYDESDFKRLDPNKMTMDDIWQDAKFVYPWSWLPCMQDLAKHEDGNGLNDSCLLDEELPFSATDYDGKTIKFRSRYLHLAPFTYEGATYLLLTTVDEYAYHIAFVIRPAPKGKYEVACTLESIRPHM